MTSCGPAPGPLPGEGAFEARIACNLFLSKLAENSSIPAYNYDKGSNDLSEAEKAQHPYFTQSGNDREENPDQYIANIRSGACCGFKYFAFDGTDTITLTVRGNAKGKLYMFSRPINPESSIDTKYADVSMMIDIHTDEWKNVSGSLAPIFGTKPIFFLFTGEGSLDLNAFTLEKAKREDAMVLL